MSKTLVHATPGIRRREHRLALLERDPCCFYCRCDLDERSATLDHRIPPRRGGTREASNLVLCCSECNLLKGSLTETEFRRAVDFIHEEPPVERIDINQLEAVQTGDFFEIELPRGHVIAIKEDDRDVAWYELAQLLHLRLGFRRGEKVPL